MVARYAEAIAAVREFDRGRCSVGFVTPAVSVCLATRRSQRGPAVEMVFAGDARNYAQTIGLADAMEGRPQPFSPSGLAGRTYSPLAHLSCAAEVDPCNAVINTLFREQLSAHDPRCVHRICQVIGELHDNVASHARGIGFSAAQSLNGWLYFAIADAGCGFLANARKVNAANTHKEAIHWAFVRGNTSARPSEDFWEQTWAPGRPARSDYDAEEENHHQGLGLAILEELVMDLGGNLWVISGDHHRTMTQGSWLPCVPAPVRWEGVAIELALPIVKMQTRGAVRESEPDDLAEELGI